MTLSDSDTLVRDRLAEIEALHRRGGGGFRVAQALTRRMDDLVTDQARSAWEDTGGLVIVALGGYGRGELCFRSDTDIMFLLEGGPEESGRHGAVRSILHKLLSTGIDLGHSVRTVEDCLKLAEEDLESWISVLESRYICGDRRLFARLTREIHARIRAYDRAQKVEQLLTRAELRHEKYGNSAKLLEPNLKNSAGGLRDLHLMLWLARATGFAFPTSSTREGSGVATLLASGRVGTVIGRDLSKQARGAMDFLLRVRNQLHLQTGNLHDTLEFATQKQVAEALGTKAGGKRSAVERFMQEYYVAARVTAMAAQRFADAMVRKYPAVREREHEVVLDARFALRGNRLHLAKPRASISNRVVLEGALHSCAHAAGFSGELQDAIGRNLRRLRPLRSTAETALFRTLLSQERGVSSALAALAELGVLERWIPEWKPMVAFFQHNVYHYYTADEHTLRVLATAEGLADSDSSYGRIYRSLPRTDVLYLACLFHDITKPRRVGDHEITGATLARKVLRRLRYEDAIADAVFLVRHHLLMEQVAFRRNLSDPQTIWDFASVFKRPEQLDYLYVLTYADLSAVNKTVWTDWKAMLLAELYEKTKDVLQRRMTQEEAYGASRRAREAATRSMVERLTEAVSGDVSQTHLDAITSPAYLDTFDHEEIAEHIRQIERKEPVATIFRHRSGHSEVTIIARDHPFALSQFCGVLAANDANIFDAQIFTRSDGIIIDRFRVYDLLTRSVLNGIQCEKIQRELTDVVAGRTDIEHLLERHRMRWRRRARSGNPNVRIDVEFETHPSFTIIDVYAADTLGFLYRITDSMSRLELNIAFAKIATRVDGIVDSFYVLDRSGAKITDRERLDTIRKELLSTIQKLAATELVVA